MGVIHTLIDAQPPPRYDNIPWNRARIQEASLEDGPYATLVTQNLTPVDAVPSDPQTRDLTFEGALAQGYYRIIWLDANDDESAPTDPAFDDGGESPAAEWAPTVDDVAALLHARTKNDMGEEIGTFDANTRPTNSQVLRLIDRAVQAVSSRVGVEPCEDHLADRAGGLAALYAAYLVEISFFPEQVRAEQSPAKQIKADYDDAIKMLVEDVKVACAGEEGSVGEGAAYNKADYNFEAPTTSLGRGTVW